MDFSPSSFSVAVLSVFLIAHAPLADAATYQYKGGGTVETPTGANWNSAASWDIGLPAPSIENILSFAGTSGYTATNNFSSGDFKLNQLLLNSSASSAITITSGSLQFLNNGAGTGPVIAQNGSGDVIIASLMKLGNTLEVTGDGTGLLTINSSISGAGGFTKSGQGTVVIAGAAANIFTGLTTVSGGELRLNKSVANGASRGNFTVGHGTLRLAANNQIIDTGTVAVTAGGTFNLGAKSDTIAGITLTGSSGAVATLDLGNPVSGVAALTIGGAAPVLTMGEHTRIIGAFEAGESIGRITSASNVPITLNFDGGSISGTVHTMGVNTTINVTQTMGSGDGVIMAGVSGTAGPLTVNLNHSGSINLGASLVAYSNATGGKSSPLTVNIAASATGLSGGTVLSSLCRFRDRHCAPLQ